MSKLLLLIALFSLNGAAEQYQILPSPESHFALEVYKTGLMAGKKHHIEFSRYRGILHYDREHPADANLRLTIESKSAVCQDNWVKPKDLEKIQQYTLNEMLDAEQYPQIVFQSTTVRSLREGQFQVGGLLTIREQTKPVTADVRVQESNPARLSFTGQAGIKLTDYHLKPPTAALGAIGTKDEMTVLFQLTGQPAK